MCVRKFIAGYVAFDRPEPNSLADDCADHQGHTVKKGNEKIAAHMHSWTSYWSSMHIPPICTQLLTLCVHSASFI